MTDKHTQIFSFERSLLYTECADIFDVCKELNLIEEDKYLQGREMLMKIVAMLIKMAKRSEKLLQSGQGHGQRQG